jgi:hypothetical protein
MNPPLRQGFGRWPKRLYAPLGAVSDIGHWCARPRRAGRGIFPKSAVFGKMILFYFVCAANKTTGAAPPLDTPLVGRDL